MEQSNPYKDDIDFSLLASQDSDFAKVLKSNGQLDFSNSESVQQLTKSLLKRDFGLKVELPADRLCPPVPNRLNYILWIQSLLDTTSDSYSDVYDPHREVLGLDIGTGASTIYPLLACTTRQNWRLAGTDIDEKSLKFADQNIHLNGLQNRIKLLQIKPEDPLIPLDTLGFENIDFTMCNPPFYSSEAEMLTSAASKQRPPFTACTGSKNEMVTTGGEVTFISRMIDESLVLRDRVQWYSSMCGKFSSVEILVKKLKERGIDNYAVTEFVQGSRTKRWGIAWSFADLRPKMSVSRGLSSLAKALLPFPSEYAIAFNGVEILKVGQSLDETLSILPLKWIWKGSIHTGVGFAEKPVWSRAFRRQVGKVIDDMEEEDGDMAFGFKIYLESGTKLIIRWIKGHDSIIFESFCGMIKRKLEEKLK